MDPKKQAIEELLKFIEGKDAERIRPKPGGLKAAMEETRKAIPKEVKGRATDRDRFIKDAHAESDKSEAEGGYELDSIEYADWLKSKGKYVPDLPELEEARKPDSNDEADKEPDEADKAQPSAEDDREAYEASRSSADEDQEASEAEEADEDRSKAEDDRSKAEDLLTEDQLEKVDGLRGKFTDEEIDKLIEFYSKDK